MVKASVHHCCARRIARDLWLALSLLVSPVGLSSPVFSAPYSAPDCFMSLRTCPSASLIQCLNEMHNLTAVEKKKGTMGKHACHLLYLRHV